MALVLLLGALWWFTREKPSETLEADGSLITAPEGPYKVKPANPKAGLPMRDLGPAN